MIKNLPDSVTKYGATPLFSEKTVPEKLTSEHDLKAGTWGKLTVVTGKLEYHIIGATREFCVIEDGDHTVIEPAQAHFVRPIGQVEFKVEFYR